MEKILIAFNFIEWLLIVILFVGVPVLTLKACGETAKETVEYEEQIVSLDYGSELTGSFTLERGTVWEKQYFVVYKVLEDGGKTVEKYPADDSVIYDILEPGETAYAKVVKNGYGALFLFTFMCRKILLNENMI